MEVIRFPQPFFLDVRDSSHAGEARRTAISLAGSCGFGNTEAATIGIIATELATNLFRHSGSGHVAVQCVSTSLGECVEILSVDNGPGMTDVGKCLQDGYTTAGTPGNGLGAIRRLSHEFDIFSIPGQGTAILSRVFRGDRRTSPVGPSVRWGVYSRPARGETVCGDSWRVDSKGNKTRFLIADGLGHGPIASQAAEAVASAFEGESSLAPAELLGAAHQKAMGTRGAAAAVAILEVSRHSVHYAGIGNISGTLLDGENGKGLFSHNGTVGVLIRKLQSFEYSWPSNGLLVMHSDGLRSRWSLGAYPGLQTRHPSIIAAILARDFIRDRDDLTVLVARIEGKAGE